MKLGIQNLLPCAALVLVFSACGSDSSSGAYVDSSLIGTNKFKFSDRRDGQVYKAVVIGEQTWMAENLNYKVEVKSFCSENSAANCEKYGRRYTWAAAIDSVALSAEGLTCGYGTTCTLPEKVQGICPEGWHLPTDAEWQTLYDFVEKDQGLDENRVGTHLKTRSTDWKEWKSDPGGKDTYGFSALPAGYYDFYAGYAACFWSASEYDNNCAYYRSLDIEYEDLYYGWHSKNHGCSVRCLKDAE